MYGNFNPFPFCWAVGAWLSDALSQLRASLGSTHLPQNALTGETFFASAN
jgi:hypothetical protein